MIIDSFMCTKILRWDLKQRNIFFGVVVSCMLSCVFCETTVDITTYTTVGTPAGSTTKESTQQRATSLPAPEWMTYSSITSSVLAVLIMLTICVWITAYVRKGNRGPNMTWSPPPINVHLHGMDGRSLSRTPSHYRSHRTVSECDQDQPPAEDKSLKSGVHTYNVIETCVHGQANDSTDILTIDGKSLEDNVTRSNEISGKISDPFSMIPNPLYRTTSCVMERKSQLPALPPRGHRSTGKDPRKVGQPQRSVPGTEKFELLDTNTIAPRALTSHGPSGNQPERSIQSVRSKSCDPLRYTDQRSKKEWCLLDSLDGLDKLDILDKPPIDDVFGEPDYSLVGNISGRSRSYSLFHLPRKHSFDPSQKPASAAVPRRGRPEASSSQRLNVASWVSASERYEMVQNPLCQPVSYNLLDRPEKTRAREIQTAGHFKSSRSGTKCSQRDVDEGYRTITDAGNEHCRVDKEYTDVK